MPFSIFIWVWVFFWLKADFLVRAFWGRRNSEEGGAPLQHSKMGKELASWTAPSPPKLPPATEDGRKAQWKYWKASSEYFKCIFIPCMFSSGQILLSQNFLSITMGTFQIQKPNFCSQKTHSDYLLVKHINAILLFLKKISTGRRDYSDCYK